MDEDRKAVLDASILIQTLVREKYTDIALKLVSMFKTIYVPPLLLYEVSNALVILTRENFITREDAERKFRSINSLPTLNIMEVILSKAIDIAIELKITLYDASYLTLALEKDAPLITTDQQLYEKGKDVARVIHASEITL